MGDWDRLRSARLDVSRRSALKGFGAAAVTALAVQPWRQAIADPIFRTDPFQLGIAAGDPAPDGFVIWTRLAPEPLAFDHGMPALAVPVDWEVGEDQGFRTIAAKGTALARPELGHAVHVEVAGLKPGRPYWYRFVAGRERSGVGRAMTTPLPGAALDRIRFAVAGCQHYEQGYFTAYRKLAAEAPDFVFCYGDYIYEGRGGRVRNTREGPVEAIRQHDGDEIYSIVDYRRRYAQYKMDPDLQAAHAAAPWFTVWDDHEIDNNWVDLLDQDDTPPGIFALRRQMAMQAYYEHMPLRASALPVGPQMQIYRRARFGNLLDLNLLDTRQYRTNQPCGDRWQPDCPGINQADAQMLGAAQEKWLMDGLGKSDAQWQALAQQVMVMDLDRNGEPGATYNLDSWGGYRIPRARLLKGIQDRRLDNVVVLTGDEHQNYAGELHLDGRNPGAKAIATEFVATSITSGGDGVDVRPDMVWVQANNPQLKFNNAQRGYMLCDVTRERWETKVRVMDRISDRNGEISTRATLVVPAGETKVVAG
ncbi:alkaline phosphatase [Sphingomonas sp. SFZ2018-12]|uniref:alkaline phosphatase D family protein n=1 Tax=Sphingomonas sp. SFZ2018-12 TaxID=2683197 RepID=UPI001F0F123F|nr:alkaline phosphatase D family protein [Sphingomonas sp. SFZ2018-12]MCH4892123.1 alkaline phosphatase [Sphingomonas sp. SFZ2018-12]